MDLRSRLGGGRHVAEAEGFLPFGCDGIAFVHGHRGVFVKHLRASSAAPGEKAEEVIFAHRASTGGGIGSGFAIGNAAFGVVHRANLAG